MTKEEVIEAAIADAFIEERGEEEEGSITLIISPLSAIEKDQCALIVLLPSAKPVVLDGELNNK